MTDYYRGYTIRLAYDQDASNPLDWTTPEGRGTWFVLQHRRYALPCEIDVDFDQYESWTELAEGMSHGRRYQFVRWYEHSGVVVSLRDDEGGQDWDAGIAGVIFGSTAAAIQASFAVWKPYVEGEVYALTITAPDTNEVDCLVGLYGYDEAMGCARWVIDTDATLSGTARIRHYGRAHAPRAQELHV